MSEPIIIPATPSSAQYADQARACWKAADILNATVDERLVPELEAAGYTCFRAARQAEALAAATEILRRLAAAGLPSSGAATSISFDAATWLDLHA